MLVLTRRVGEEIVISENIRISIVQVAGNRVRVGIEAPRSVSVRRREMVDQLRSQSPLAIPSGCPQ